MGDQFFNGMFPFVDVDSGGDVAGFIKNVAGTIEKIPPGAKIIPGHGPIASIDDLKKFHAALVQTVDAVKASIAKGLSLEEAKKAGLPPEYGSYSWNFVTTERWIETVYKGLSKK
jgi:glyoxylase-like metal-dependent hydrolase (beta-lactamase superfamily II)